MIDRYEVMILLFILLMGISIGCGIVVISILVKG